MRAVVRRSNRDRSNAEIGQKPEIDLVAGHQIEVEAAPLADGVACGFWIKLVVGFGKRGGKARNGVCWQEDDKINVVRRPGLALKAGRNRACDHEGDLKSAQRLDNPG
jgi:hypothetical protein